MGYRNKLYTTKFTQRLCAILISNTEHSRALATDKYVNAVILVWHITKIHLYCEISDDLETRN